MTSFFRHLGHPFRSLHMVGLLLAVTLGVAAMGGPL